MGPRVASEISHHLERHRLVEVGFALVKVVENSRSAESGNVPAVIKGRKLLVRRLLLMKGEKYRRRFGCQSAARESEGRFEKLLLILLRRGRLLENHGFFARGSDFFFFEGSSRGEDSVFVSKLNLTEVRFRDAAGVVDWSVLMDEISVWVSEEPTVVRRWRKMCWHTRHVFFGQTI